MCAEMPMFRILSSDNSSRLGAAAGLVHIRRKQVMGFQPWPEFSLAMLNMVYTVLILHYFGLEKSYTI
jgi:hypothetical protein